ncbi:MAG: FAD:protein FMN transferase [Phycisphaerales bacterium]|nr:FAD:protein FMN transferase [Phycisphaerales bacterium]
MTRWLVHGVWLALATGCGSTDSLQRFEYVEMAMASPARLVLYAESETIARQAARRTYDRLHELDRSLSDWNERSELNRLLGAAPEPFTVSDTLQEAIVLALEHARSSNGAFDPTIGPVVELWRQARANGTLPDDSELSAARALVGIDAIELGDGTVRIARAGSKIDFGGIGKGIAIDEARDILQREGIKHHLIDFDGEIGVGHPPPGQDAWRVSVQLAREIGSETLELEVTNCAISTSGDRHQFMTIGKTRYSHVVDPTTGLGLTRQIQVTVVSPSGATSDALATAGCVLGPTGLAELIEHSYPEASALVGTVRDGKNTLTRIGRIPVLAHDAP